MTAEGNADVEAGAFVVWMSEAAGVEALGCGSGLVVEDAGGGAAAEEEGGACNEDDCEDVAGACG